MWPVFVVAAKDLRQRARDRSAWVLGFLAPLAIAALVSFAFGGAETFHADVAVVDEDHGVLARTFTGLLTSPELASVLTVTAVGDAADARARVDRGAVGAAVVIPAGFSAAAGGAPSRPVTVLTTVDSPLAGQVVRSVAESFAAQLDANRLSVASAVAAGAPAGDLTARAAQLRLPEQVVRQASGSRPISGVEYFAPAMGIFFLFFAMGFGARGYFLELRDGTLDRIAVAPGGRGAALAGKSLATFAYSVAGLGTVCLVTSMAFGADWGPLPAVAVLIFAVALSVACLTAFVITVSRTERQADGLAAILTFGLVLVGGQFVFAGTGPELVRRLALFTPNGWALRGFTDLAGGAPGTSVAVPVLAILAFCALLALVTGVLQRRAVRR
ncbi:ABC-2 type transport system permease protein [Amycolatopsis lexingtonensis]|uniref:ABC-2 type transport system permease protein n=1 Tax=Amycolatopsis lexingtonensis TaxID=218822 RepID=A0ABR9HXI2_9PSEU|nr:ABC transporter permease [Amycolatopsis lexingtonensis]MBE1495646.1 ABC-2 type transport system permease protein [Amycolatopsis lexingtonensis]